MTSAALDACLCLLLVSAAAVTVTSVSPPAAETDRADAVAETLAVETAQVSYTLRPVGEDRSEAGPEYDRNAHGTLASLLARAAVGSVEVDDEALTRTREGFVTAVRETVAERLPARTQVVVAFRPYPGAHLGSDLTVGPTPPEHADVHAATIRAPSWMSEPNFPTKATASEGFDGLGDAVAAELVRGLFPPEKGRLALAGDPPVRSLVEHRYARAGAAYDTRTADAIGRGDTHSANRQLEARMSERVAADLRDRFASPEAAADALRVSDVRISVRTWSA